MTSRRSARGCSSSAALQFVCSTAVRLQHCSSSAVRAVIFRRGIVTEPPSARYYVTDDSRQQEDVLASDHTALSLLSVLARPLKIGPFSRRSEGRSRGGAVGWSADGQRRAGREAGTMTDPATTESRSASLTDVSPRGVVAGPVPLVRYLVVAEFDIDKGSVLRCQYPQAVPGIAEASLAESMLPEGGHLHESDWTVFVIRPPAAATSPPDARLGTGTPAHANDANGEANRILPLQLQCQEEVCQFVIRAKCFVLDPADKQYGPIDEASDTSVVRFRVVRKVTRSSPPLYSLDVETPDSGAVLRSTTVGGDLRYSFRDEDLFAVIDFDQDTSLSVQFASQDDLLRFESVLCKVLDSTVGNVFSWDTADDAWQDAMLDPEIDNRFIRSRENDAATLVAINLVKTKKVQTVRRGAVVKAVAFVATRRYVDMFRPLMVKVLDEVFALPDGDHVGELLAGVFAAVNGAQCPSVEINPLHTRVVRSLCGYGDGCPSSPCEITIAGESFTLRVPIVDVFEEELGGVSVVQLVKTFGDGVMTLYNAAFVGRRILFLGHNLSAATVSKMVLATASLVHPLNGLLDRVFPYAHLTDLEFLQVPGFIAGVTNPIFANHWEWFDVLADIKEGTVSTSASQYANGGTAVVATGSLSPEKVGDGASTTSHEMIDAEVYAQMTSAGTATFGEEYTRAVLHDHTVSLLDQVYSRELFRDDNRRRISFDGNAARVQEFRIGPSFDPFDIRQRFGQCHSAFGRNLNTLRTSVRLMQVRRLPPRQMQAILEEIASRLQTEEHVWQMLELLPESRSGLLPIAVGLFSAKSVQASAFDLLRRIESVGVGAKAIDQLPMMVLMAYRRLKRRQRDDEQRQQQQQAQRATDDRIRQYPSSNSDRVKDGNGPPMWSKLHVRPASFQTDEATTTTTTTSLPFRLNIDTPTATMADKTVLSPALSTRRLTIDLVDSSDEDDGFGDVGSPRAAHLDVVSDDSSAYASDHGPARD